MMDARDGTNDAMIGSPGNDGLYWLKPVRPGDTLTGTITTVDKKRSQSKPWMGAVFNRVEVQNQRGEDVYRMEGRGLVLCRPEEGAAPPRHTPGKAQQAAANPDLDWSRALDPMGRPRIHFEDFEPGQVWDLGAETVSKSEILDFAANFDPQPFHLDEDAAKKTHFGGLVASGWHTAAVFMGLFARNMLANTASLGSAGMKGLRWRKPLRPGDTVRGRVEVKELKRSQSKPWMGFVFIDYYLSNQHGEDILYMDGSGIYGSREHKRDAA
jgi:acyl dehydratase